MKNKIPILFITLFGAFVIFLNIRKIKYKNEDTEKPQIAPINIEEEMNNKVSLNENDLEEGNIEYSTGEKEFYVNGIESLFDFIPPDAVFDYEFLLNDIAQLLRKEENGELLKVYFGIVRDDIPYSDENPLYAEIDSINHNKNYLKVDYTIVYKDYRFSDTHFLNYQYVKGSPWIFLYDSSLNENNFTKKIKIEEKTSYEKLQNKEYVSYRYINSILSKYFYFINNEEFEAATNMLYASYRDFFEITNKD